MEPTQFTGEDDFASKHMEQAIFLIQVGRYDDAQKELMQVLAASPDSAHAHTLLAIALLNLDKKTEALQSAQRAIGLEPDTSYYQSVLAITLLGNNRKKEALTAAQEGVHLDPNSDYAYTIESHIYLALSRWQDALDSAERGLAIDSDSVDLINTRSVALTNLGLRDDAATAIDTALRNQPDNAHTHANKGWNLLHDGQYKEAMHSFREALRLEPNNEWARQGIIESIKAGTVIYRPILKLFLWLSTLPPNTIFMLFIGFFILGRFLGPLERNNPEYTDEIRIVRYGYMGIIFLSWTANAMFNVVLFAHPIGKHALNKMQKIESAITGVLLVLGVSAIAGYLLGFQSDPITYTIWIALGMIIPISGLDNFSTSKWRLGHVGTCLTMGLVGLGTIFLPPGLNSLCFLIFMFSLVAYSWITSLGSFAAQR